MEKSFRKSILFYGTSYRTYLPLTPRPRKATGAFPAYTRPPALVSAYRGPARLRWEGWATGGRGRSGEGGEVWTPRGLGSAVGQFSMALRRRGPRSEVGRGDPSGPRKGGGRRLFERRAGPRLRRPCLICQRVRFGAARLGHARLRCARLSFLAPTRGTGTGWVGRGGAHSARGAQGSGVSGSRRLRRSGDEGGDGREWPAFCSERRSPSRGSGPPLAELVRTGPGAPATTTISPGCPLTT